MSAVYPRLWRYAVALTGRRDWGDDLAQTTCLRALDKADQFEVGTHLDRWNARPKRSVTGPKISRSEHGFFVSMP